MRMFWSTSIRSRTVLGIVDIVALYYQLERVDTMFIE